MVCFKEIGVTDYAVELPPVSAARMAVGANIAVSDPAIIGARFVGTVLGMGIDCSRASSLAGAQGWRGNRWRVDMRRALLTGRTVRLFSQAGEGLGGLWWSCGPLSPRVFRCLPSRVHPIREHQLPEQREEQKLVEKWGAYHGIPFLCRSNGGMLPVFRANELSAGWRYTTGIMPGLIYTPLVDPWFK